MITKYCTITLLAILLCCACSESETTIVVPTETGVAGSDDPRLTYGTLSEDASLQNEITTFSNHLISSIRTQRVIGGEMLIIKNGKVLLHKAAGWEDKENNQPLDLNKTYLIRDLNLLFNISVLLKFVEDEKIDLCQPVATYLTEFNTEKSQHITIEHLLRHTSGFTRRTFPKSPRSYDDIFQALKDRADEGPENQPGTVRKPRALNILIVKAILEVISGQTYPNTIRDHLWNPLGMENTIIDINQNPSLLQNAISRYELHPDNSFTKKWQNDRDQDYSYKWYSNDVYSTIVDYAIFLDMWINNGHHNETQFVTENLIRYFKNVIYEPINAEDPDKCLFNESVQTDDDNEIKPRYLATAPGPTIYASTSHKLIGLYFTQTTWNSSNHVFWTKMAALDNHFN